MDRRIAERCHALERGGQVLPARDVDGLEQFLDRRRQLDALRRDAGEVGQRVGDS